MVLYLHVIHFYNVIFFNLGSMKHMNIDKRSILIQNKYLVSYSKMIKVSF